MKKILCAVLVISLLTPVAFAKSSGAIQTELKELREQEEALTAEGTEVEEQIHAKDFQSKTASAQKSDLDKSVFVIQAQIQNTNAQIQQYALLIAEEQKKLEEAIEEQEAMQEKYQARIRAMEEAGPISYWSILFQSKSFSDLLGRIDAIAEIAKADQKMMKALQEKTEQIETQRDFLAEQTAEQNALKEKLQHKELELQEKRAQADQMIRDLEQDKLALSEDAAEIEAQQKALREEILAAQQEYEAALSAEEAYRLAQANQNNLAGGGGSPNTGAGASGADTGFIAPVSGYVITSTYGWRIHPIHKDRRFHHGLDYAVPMHTPIVACAAGTVTATGYSEWNGYYVSVSHGNGYMTTYCHMTHYIVSNGQSVSQGETLGYVGTSGWSNGPHVHMEFYVNGAETNPAQYLPA